MTGATEESRIPVPAESASLDEWLAWLETIHPVSIDMGLERVSEVADRLQLRPLAKPLILVGGTNGKGSTVAMLSAIYTMAGYKVGAYTSPHIDHFCERIRINQVMASERDVVDALAFVEAQRAPQTLTYFEYTTLAAMRVFMRHDCDVYLFEVGLGGRLDATNLWDADCAVLTSIALDHESYLGNDLSVIATEKAAIGRPGNTLIVGETQPPESLFEFAKENNITVEHVGAYEDADLPFTAMSGAHQKRNAACAVAAVAELKQVLPVDQQTLNQALSSASLSARFERIRVGELEVILDVAHNPAGAQALSATWRRELGDQRAETIFAVLLDKDLDGIVSALDPIVASWHCIELDVARANSVKRLADMLIKTGKQRQVLAHQTVGDAWIAARDAALENERAILIAGSFHTIAALRAVIAHDS
ncbi:MAG: folylpolyglutamate synthase/dihydrofolate synthase family protein [Granulosicoccus sp.]